MNLRTFARFCLIGALVWQPALAESTPQHFKGAAADTMAEAVTNLSRYNQTLATILTQKSLSASDLNDVHQLTYSLENALNRIKIELTRLSEQLEAVHQASEHNDTERVQTQGQAYLALSRELAK